MSFHSSLGISLHLRVDGCIDFQSVEIEVVFSTIGFRVLVYPGFHIRTQVLTEVGCHPVVMTFGGKLDFQWQLLQGIFLFLGNGVVLSHLGEYHIATVSYSFFIFHRIVESRVFKHPYKHCAFFYFEVFRFFIEVDFSSRTDTIGIVIEVVDIKVHC